MEPRHADKIGGWWLATSLELEEGENISYRGLIILRQSGTYGELFLTTKRLVWIRQRFALPWMRRLVEVPLGDIEGWSIEPVPWWWFQRFGRRRRTVRIRTASRTYDFITVWTREDAEEWAEALKNVMAGAGIVPAEAVE
jgi:hypothetical protein